MLPKPDPHDGYSAERRDPISFAEAEREAYFHCQNSLEGAQRSAIRTAMFGPLPFIAMVVVGWAISLREKGQTPITMTERLETLLAWLFVVVGAGLLYTVLVGLVTGAFAHRIAFEKSVPVTRLAVALTWVVNLTVWGWWLVLVL